MKGSGLKDMEMQRRIEAGGYIKVRLKMALA
jgi:hypothetical protein